MLLSILYGMNKMGENTVKLILKSLENEFGAYVTCRIIETSSSQLGVSKKELLTDFELFSKAIKITYGRAGAGKILPPIKDDLQQLRIKNFQD